MPLLKNVNVDDGGPHPYLFFAKISSFKTSVGAEEKAREAFHRQ